MTLITPSLPERGEMLAAALGDWAQQTVPVNEIRVGIDNHLRRQRQGPAVIRNALANHLRTTWIAFGDDDDRFDPDHLETLLEHSEDADVVWSFCRVRGADWRPEHRCPPEHGQIPMTALIRAEAFQAVRGFCTTVQNEDEELFGSLLAAGARFQCVHETTWTYNFGHGTNRSRDQLPEGWEDAIRAKIAAGAEPTVLTRELLGEK